MKLSLRSDYLKTILLLFSAIFAVGLVSCAPKESVDAEKGEVSLETVNCWFQIDRTLPETTCYSVYVPQNYGDPEGLWVRFPVIKLASLSADSDKSPVLHLGGGGPGNPIGFEPDYVGEWLWDWYQEMSVKNQRDIYIIDPRGVGYAEPVLVCDEYLEAFDSGISLNLTFSQENQLIKSADEACLNRFSASGIDPAQYHSLNVSRDMEQLRQLFGIEKWSLYGISYGTRYALTMAREFPNTVESMVLDAAVFPNVPYIEKFAESYSQAYDRLFEYCRNDAWCASGLPEDPEESFWKVFEQLSKAPLVAEIYHPYSDNEISVVLNGNRFLRVVFSALYDAEFFKDLPEVLSSLQTGSLGPLLYPLYTWIADQTNPTYSDVSATGHYCYEESPFVNYDKAVENAMGLRSGLREMVVGDIVYAQEQCESWGIQSGGELESRPIETDIPTLFLHGGLDPVLPVHDIERQMQYFKNSDYVIFDNISHGVVGVHPCGEQLAKIFFDMKTDFRDAVTCLE